MKTNYLKLVNTIIFLALFIQANAQNVEIQQGKEYKAKNRSFINTIMYKDLNSMMAIRSFPQLIGNTNYSVEMFNNNLNLISNKDIELPDRDLNIERFIYSNNQAYIFTSRYDKDKGINSLYGSTLDKNGKINDNYYELANVEADKKREINFFDITLSADSTKFLVTIVPHQKKDDQAQLAFLVFDLEFKELDNFMVELPFEAKRFEMNEYLLDKDRNVHILGNVQIKEEGKNRIFQANIEREARVFSFYKDSDELVEYKLAFDNSKEDETYLNEIRLGIDKLGRLQLTGFYSEKKGAFMKGVFNSTIDIEKKKAINIKSQVFTDEFLNQFLTDRQIKSKQRKKDKNKDSRFDHLNNYKIREIVFKEDGGFYLVAEYYFYYVVMQTSTNGITTTTEHYIYGDIMAINVKEDNSIDWFARIPKFQHTTNDRGRYSGIAKAVDSKNTLQIIFNEHKKNANIIDPERKRNAVGKKTITVLVSIEESTKTTKTPLMPAKDGKTIITPKGHYQVSSNELILEATTGNKSKFINLKFEN